MKKIFSLCISFSVCKWLVSVLCFKKIMLVSGNNLNPTASLTRLAVTCVPLEFLFTSNFSITHCFCSFFSGHQQPVFDYGQRSGVWRWREHRLWDSLCPHRLWFSWLQLPLQTRQPHHWAPCCVSLCCKRRSKRLIDICFVKIYVFTQRML